MANTARHIDLAVLEVMETEIEAEKLLRIISAAQADGEITVDESKAILAQAAEVLREAEEDVLAVERANVAELILASLLKDGTVSSYLLKKARDVGLVVAFPMVELPATVELRKTA